MSTIYLPDKTRDRLRELARESGYKVVASGQGSEQHKFVSDLLSVYEEMREGEWKRLRARCVLLQNATPAAPRSKRTKGTT